MKGKFASLLAVALLTICFYPAAPASAASMPSYYFYYGFDDTVKPWAPGSNNGYTDENTLRLAFDGVFDKSSPNGYALLTGNYSTPLWMKAGFKAAGTRARIEFLARDNGSCAGCIPIVYAGRSDAKDAGQFVTDFVTLDKEWRYYEFEIKLNQGTAPRSDIVVAIGFANLDDGAENSTGCPVTQYMAVDNVHVSVFGIDK